MFPADFEGNILSGFRWKNIRGLSTEGRGTQFLKRRQVETERKCFEAFLKQVRILKELELFAKIDRRNFFSIIVERTLFQAVVFNCC